MSQNHFTYSNVVFVLDVSTIDLEVISEGCHYVYRPRQQLDLSAQGIFALSALELGTRAVTVFYVSHLRYLEDMRDCEEVLHEEQSRGLMPGDCGGQGCLIPNKVR
jgi:hypothetical protein